MKDTIRREADAAGKLRQMIAVLESERQALAGFDAEALSAATHQKEQLCDALEPMSGDGLDEEALSLARTAQHLNEVNRRVRNLLAANVAARLEALDTARGSSVTGQIARA